MNINTLTEFTVVCRLFGCAAHEHPRLFKYRLLFFVCALQFVVRVFLGGFVYMSGFLRPQKLYGQKLFDIASKTENTEY